VYNQEGPITDRAMARMLAPFEIRSRSLRFKASFESTSPHRGYMVQDFVPVWARLLGSEPLFRSNRYPTTEEDATLFCQALERDQSAALEREPARSRAEAAHSRPEAGKGKGEGEREGKKNQ